MFHKQNARHPLAVVLLALLLALTSSFSCIGLSGWASFQRQLAKLDAQYTTVAYPINSGIRAFGKSYFVLSKRGYTILEDGTVIAPDGTVHVSDKRVVELTQAAPGVLRRDTSILAAAHTPNQKGLSSGTVDPMAYVRVYDEGRYAQTVTAMRCLSVEKYLDFGRSPYDMNYYLFWFEWIEPVCRMDAYDLLEHSRVLRFFYPFGLVLDEEGNPYSPFEEGKTYLFRGTFKDFQTMYWFVSKEKGYDWFRYTQDYVRSVYDQDPLETWVDPTLEPAKHLNDTPWQILDISLPLRGKDGSSLTTDDMGHSYPLTPNFYLDAEALPVEKNGLGVGWTTQVPEDSWPIWTEYEGDWRDFLNTEEGRVWRDEIIPNCELNYDSVPVLLTDNVQGLSQFCKEESALLEGRFITQEEYDRGDAVCMISAEYALYNNLTVGDTLTLDLYDTGHVTSMGAVNSREPLIKAHKKRGIQSK